MDHVKINFDNSLIWIIQMGSHGLYFPLKFLIKDVVKYLSFYFSWNILIVVCLTRESILIVRDTHFRKTEDELHDVRRQFERDTENFEFTKSSLRRQKEALEGEITSLQQEVNGLKMSVAQLTSSQAGLQSELEATKVSLRTLPVLIISLSKFILVFLW